MENNKNKDHQRWKQTSHVRDRQMPQSHTHTHTHTQGKRANEIKQGAPEKTIKERRADTCKQEEGERV